MQVSEVCVCVHARIRWVYVCAMYVCVYVFMYVGCCDDDDDDDDDDDAKKQKCNNAESIEGIGRELSPEKRF